MFHVLSHHIVSLDCEVEEFMYLLLLLRLFGPVFLDEADHILAHRLGLRDILDLIETLGGCCLSFEQPVEQVTVRYVLALIDHRLYILDDGLRALVGREIVPAGIVNFCLPVFEN